MKAGKNCRLPLLILFCALSLSGCAFIAGGDDSQSQEAQTDNVKKAEAELKVAKTRFEQAEETAKKATDGVVAAVEEEGKAREKAEAARADTIKLGKNPDDPDDAPKTTAAIKAHKEAEKKVDDARKGETDAKGGVQVAKDKVDEATRKLAAVQNPDTGLLPWWLSYILLGIVGVAALAAIGYVLSRAMTASREQRQLAFNSVTAGQEGSAKRLENLIGELGRKTDAHFSQQSREVGAVNERITTLRQEFEMLRRTLGTGVASPPPSGSYQGAVAEIKEQPAFPVSAVEYLNREGRNATRVKSDSLNGILVKDTDGAGEMVVVEDYSSSFSQLYAVPTAGSFRTKSDFHVYYEKYYECHRPAGGEVWINRPATVNRVDGGWELRDKGELEVR